MRGVTRKSKTKNEINNSIISLNFGANAFVDDPIFLLAGSITIIN
jgi:hypothetical protein